MRLIAAAVIGLCIAGVALAQTPSGEAPEVSAQRAEPFEPHWEQRAPIRRAYPSAALRNGVSGVTHLCCTLQPNRTLACDVALELPEHAGFGRSARRYMAASVLTRESAAALQERSNPRLHVAWLYATPSAAPELEATASELLAQNANLCGPGSVQATDYIRVIGSVNGQQR